MNDPDKKRFLWGVALAWTPWVPAMVGLGTVFRGIAGTKATGLAVVAGGFIEGCATFGIAATFVCEISAMVLLFRSFSREHEARSIFSVISIGASALMILLFSLSLWLFWSAQHGKF